MPEFTLMDHQKEGVKFLDSVDGIGALLWDPGVGKTGATLAWVDKMAKRKGEFRVLVVSPKTAIDTWVLQAPPFMDSAVKARVLQGTTSALLPQIRRARDWLSVPTMPIQVNHPGHPEAWPTSKGKGPRVTLLSMSAGAVSNWCQDRKNTVKLLLAIKKFAPDLVVVDESHLIKSETANISKAMYQIGQIADHRIILTGTVNPLSPLDCYGQWRFLAPWTFSDQYHMKWTKAPLSMTLAQKKSIRPWSFKSFAGRYADFGGYGGAAIVGENDDHLAELHARVAERSMVVRKEDALDLPPTVDVDVRVDLSAAEKKAYDSMLADLQAELADGTLIESPNALAKIMKLRQITAGFIRDTEMDETHILGDAKRKAVAEVVNVRLASENRIVVFAYFRSECEALHKSLAAKGRTVEVITGQTKTADRLAIRQRFADVSGNPEQVVLVAQARTMSLSVNELVTAQHAVYASLSERRDDWVQSRGRLDRNGQKGSKVTFWRVFVPGTIDAVMYANNERRGRLEKALLDYVRTAPRLSK